MEQGGAKRRRGNGSGPLISRPYSNRSIIELEAVFRNAPSDEGTLRELFHELHHRKTKRAMMLLVVVTRELERPSPPAATPASLPHVPTGSGMTPLPRPPLPPVAVRYTPPPAVALGCPPQGGGGLSRDDRLKLSSHWGGVILIGIIGWVIYAGASGPPSRSSTPHLSPTGSSRVRSSGLGRSTLSTGHSSYGRLGWSMPSTADFAETGSSRTFYGGGGHTHSHGGHYVAGIGSSHRGGHYVNPRGGHTYGRHK